jgi:RimJ/RimL family protein N-acetyltransferase
MDHTLTIEGYGIRLRPVRMDDAAFIVWLRNLEHVKGRVGDSATDVAQQEQWLKTYFSREGDYYFLVETLGGLMVGAYGIYDKAGKTAVSGRWIIRRDVPAAIPSAILGFNLAFGALGLEELRASTVSTNLPVLSLNRKFGLEQVMIEPGASRIGGKPVDLVHFVLYPKEWAKARERILPLAKQAETQIREWERSQPGTPCVQ